MQQQYFLTGTLGLVAPRTTFDELLAVNSFVAAKAGLPPLNDVEHDAYANQVRETFGMLNERQKRYLANGEINRLKLIRAWKSWKPQEQSKHLRIVGAHNINSYERVPQVARNLEHWAGIDLSSQAMLKLVGYQGDVMVLQHLRGMLSDH